jgi:glutamyl-Q tRNA(Asp) synthetase
MNRPTFRFAPSPNGELHLGHAYSALLNRELAQATGGRLLLRIEDIDITRCTPEFEAGIFHDLAWLGFDWERPVRRQSEHFAEYEATLRRLIGEELVYPAFMSRGEIRAFIAGREQSGEDWPRDPDGVPLYPGVDKALSSTERRRRIDAGLPFAWRLNVEAVTTRIGSKLAWVEFADERLAGARRPQACPQDWGDVIVARREVPTSYHLSVVIDDALQGITHVVRGRDLFPATSIQRLLQELLGLPQPAYLHHRLLLGPDGRKLSKSQAATGLSALRENGATPETIRQLTGL